MVFYLEHVRKLMKAGNIALDFLSGLPEIGRIIDVDFVAGRPDIDTLPLYIIVDGRKSLLFDIKASYPAFENIRRWIERCCEHSAFGSYYGDMVVIDSLRYLTCMLSWQCGYSTSPTLRSISVMAIFKSNNDKPVELFFCETERTFRNLYRALTRAVDMYGEFFDTPGNWLIPDRKYVPMRKKTVLIKEQLYSIFLSENLL